MVLTCDASRSGYIVHTCVNIVGLNAGADVHVYLLRCSKQAKLLKKNVV